jgi:hypothetical protein
MFSLVFLSISCCFGFIGLFNFMLSKQLSSAFFLQTIGWGMILLGIWALPWAISAPSNEEYVCAYMGLCVLANASGWRIWKNKNKLDFLPQAPVSLPILTDILDSDLHNRTATVPKPVPSEALVVRALSPVEYLIGGALVYASYLLGQEAGARGTAHLPPVFLMISIAATLYPLALFLIARLHFAGFWVKAVVSLLLAGCYAADFLRFGVDEGMHALFFALGLGFLSVLNAYFGLVWLRARSNHPKNTPA